MPRESKTSARRVTAHDRHREALELRKAGKSYPVIAETMGYSLAGAYKAVMSALKEVTREPAEEVLELEVARLDAMIEKLWPEIRAGGKNMTWHIDRVLKIMERRAALLGLDAPVKREDTLHLTFQRLADQVAKDLDLEPAELVAEAERIIAQAARP
jgi:hypothetical protein